MQGSRNGANHNYIGSARAILRYAMCSTYFVGRVRRQTKAGRVSLEFGVNRGLIIFLQNSTAQLLELGNRHAFTFSLSRSSHSQRYVFSQLGRMETINTRG